MAGVQGKYSALFPWDVCLWFNSCMAPNNDLDSGPHPWCNREHTDMLVEMFELGELWNEYGLIGNIMVSPLLLSQPFYFFVPSVSHLLPFISLMIFLHSHLQTSSPMQTYTNCWLPTYCTSSSRGPSRTILWLGSSLTSRQSTQSDKPIRFLMI